MDLKMCAPLRKGTAAAPPPSMLLHLSGPPQAPLWARALGIGSSLRKMPNSIVVGIPAVLTTAASSVPQPPPTADVDSMSGMGLGL